MPKTVVVLFTLSAVAVLCLAVVGPGEFRSGPGPEGVADMELRGLADAVEMYVLERRGLPATLVDLTRTSARDGEPYIDEIPLDPWSHAYEYTLLDVPTRRFRLRSYGPDGRVAIEDDLTWPKEER